MNLFKVSSESKLPRIVQKFEQEPVITTNGDNRYSEDDEIPFFCVEDYLYHGLRNQRYLEKLEGIFLTQKILAGKYLKGYSNYSDNCNRGENVSVLKWLGTNELEHETFILENVSLIISPLCDAIETKFVSYNNWHDLQQIKPRPKFRQIYSYMNGECQCKDFIPFSMVRAIGVPYQNLRLQGKANYAEQLIQDIIKLMEQYGISLPVVDTSLYNRTIVEAEKVSRK